MAKIKRRQKPGLERNTTQLVWRDKRTEVDRVILPFQTAEIVNEPREKSLYTGREFEDGWRNKLIWGDNKYIMASLLPKFAGKINLIYIDPPFATGADFSINIKVGDLEWTKEASVIEELAYRDTWGKGLDSYLQMMYDRLVLMRELLAETGSIYVHLDWHVGHYVKAIMDEIFGKENFRNEIIVKRGRRKSLMKQFESISQMHVANDMLLWYSRNKDAKFRHPINKEGSVPSQWMGFWSNVNRPTMRYQLLGVTPKRGQWKWERERAFKAAQNYREYLEKYQENMPLKEYWQRTGGQLEFIRKRPSTKYAEYWIPPKDFEYLDNNWLDIQAYSYQTGFATEKHEALLKRIVQNFSNEGDLVADFFCGSGTTGVVAEKLNRRWIISDLSKFAIHTTRKRLLDNPECRPFEIVNLGNYQKQKFIENKHPPVEKYIKFILELYRAERLDGYSFIHGKKAGRLVHIASVDSMVTQRELRDVLEEVAASGSKTLDVLGWDFEMGLHGIVQEIADEYGLNVRLVQIPKEALEVKSPAKEEIKFFDLNFVEVDYEVKRKKLVIELKDFVIANQEYIPDEVRAKIEKFTDYIDYWAVDFDYKEDTFHNAWQSFRTRKHPSLEKKCVYVYKEPGEHLVLVKVVDIFGNDTNKVLRVMVG